MPHNEYTIERDSNFISGFGRATRVVTLHDQHPLKVRGEWYVLIDDCRPLFGMGHVEVDLNETDVNHRKLMNILKNEADLLISSLLEERISGNGNPVAISYQHNWEIIGEPELIEIWLPGRHAPAFRKIIDTTECVPLKSILLDVIKFPHIELKSTSASCQVNVGNAD